MFCANDSKVDWIYDYCRDHGFQPKVQILCENLNRSIDVIANSHILALGYNTNYLYDMGEGGLDQLSMDMVYAVEPGAEAAYLKYWQDYILRWNDMLPELPLYSNILVTAVPTWVENYEENAYWDFAHAVLYATIPSAQ